MWSGRGEEAGGYGLTVKYQNICSYFTLQLKVSETAGSSEVERGEDSKDSRNYFLNVIRALHSGGHTGVSYCVSDQASRQISQGGRESGGCGGGGGDQRKVLVIFK